MELQRVSTLLGSLLLVTVSVANSAALRQFADFVLNSANEPRIVGFDEETAFVRLGVHSAATSSWTCMTLSDALGMGGGLLATGADGLALLDVAGTPYVAYTVFKRLYPEKPAECGVTYVDREQL